MMEIPTYGELLKLMWFLVADIDTPRIDKSISPGLILWVTVSIAISRESKLNSAACGVTPRSSPATFRPAIDTCAAPSVIVVVPRMTT